jgi:hypothetical protein
MAGARNSTRLNVTLDPEHAEKLSRSRSAPQRPTTSHD